MPNPLSAPFVEQVRVAWERHLERALSAQRLQQSPCDGSCLEQAVPLSEASAARVYRVAREVAACVDWDEPLVIYQTRAEREVNCQALTDHPQAGLRLIGLALALLDDAALAAMLGHEFGHLLAHRPQLHTALADAHPVVLAHSVACELSADRIGLLACQDLKAVVRLEVCSATGISAENLGLRELAYLDEACERVESGSTALLDHTHPSRDFRLYATRLFWRTDEYQKLTGASDAPADLSLEDVESKLTAMLCTPELERAIARLRPARENDELERRFEQLEQRAAEEERARLGELERRFAELEKR